MSSIGYQERSLEIKAARVLLTTSPIELRFVCKHFGLTAYTQCVYVDGEIVIYFYILSSTLRVVQNQI